MTARILIKNLAALENGTVTVSGWVDTVRDQKKVQFVVLRDETGAVQLVNPRSTDAEGVVVTDEPASTISALSQGS
ncbi:MAG: aspartate--tRNA(Asn) ligase, partial [Ramlibacter sp.]|nr:aspartate--tRNA(Asn) ligase [Cryobacterium sp.]